MCSVLIDPIQHYNRIIIKENLDHRCLIHTYFKHCTCDATSQTQDPVTMTCIILANYIPIKVHNTYNMVMY